MISVAAAEAMKVQVVQSINSSLELMIQGDPVEKTLMASKHVITSMLELILTLDEGQQNYTVLADQFSSLKDKSQLQDAKIEALTLNLDKAKAKKTHSDEWKAKAKKYFAQLSDTKKVVEDKDAMIGDLESQVSSLGTALVASDEAMNNFGEEKVQYYKNWKQAEANYTSLYNSHQKTVEHKNNTISSLEAQVISLQKSVKEPGIGYVSQSAYDELDKKYSEALQSWSQEKVHSKHYQNSRDAWLEKAQNAYKQLLLIEGITADLRSLVKDAILWGEEQQQKWFDAGHQIGKLQYQEHHVYGKKPWYFRGPVQGDVMKWIVDRNDTIREDWDAKLKEAVNG